jgi:hypothetical protein
MPLLSSTRLALPALLALFLSMPALAEWRDIPYADVAKMPLGLKKADPQGIYSYSYIATPAEGKTALPPGLKLQIKAGDQIVPIPIASDGKVDMPFRSDWADSGAVVQVNQPKGSFRMTFNMNPRVPAGTRMSYANLTESATVIERGIKQMAGMLSIFAPKVKAFVLHFPPGSAQTATLIWPDGKRKFWKTAANGLINLPWKPEWAQVMVELSAPLKDVSPLLK